MQFSTTYQTAYLFMLAEPKLVEYAYRVAQDVPAEVDIVNFTKATADLNSGSNSKRKQAIHFPYTSSSLEFSIESSCKSLINDFSRQQAKRALTESYEKAFNIFGKFKQQTIELSLL